MSNILGFNTLNILVLLVIMLIVAGPKRMIQWAYTVGQYIGKFRAMFQETMNTINKELQAADPGLAQNLKDLTKVGASFDILSEANKVINAEPTKPVTPVAPIVPAPTEPPTASEAADEKPRYDAWLQK